MRLSFTTKGQTNHTHFRSTYCLCRCVNALILMARCQDRYPTPALYKTWRASSFSYGYRWILVIQVMWLVVTEVRSARARVALWWVLLQHYYAAVLSIVQSPILQTLYFPSSSVVSRTFSARRTYSMFGHHP